MVLFTPLHLLVLLILASIFLVPIWAVVHRKRAYWTSCPLCLNPVRVGAIRCQHCHGEISR